MDSKSVSRRELLRIAGMTSVAGSLGAVEGAAQLRVDMPPKPGDSPEYLTKDKDFGTVERGNPFPYAQPEAKLRQIGMIRDTWTLEVVPDTATGSKADNPMTKERGTALDFPALMKLAETRAVRFLKVISCNNLNIPLGMGLWEGVPLRDVVWMARPVTDIRRVIYYGHHNEDPKQMFRGSLSLSRVLEDPPGDYPVILAYKLNGEYLSGRRGGPVRMIVPEAYGFKSVKWLQRVILTNLPGANDTYADEDNDVDSWMKSLARILVCPEKTKAGKAISVLGVAQAGLGGLAKVQYWVSRQGDRLPPDDPLFTKAPWQDARILPPPSRWGGGSSQNSVPPSTLGFDNSGQPKSWPLRYSIAHWTAAIPGLSAGVYDIRCRTIDSNGVAQPMPRPLPHSGVNHIEAVKLIVEG